MEKQSQVAGDSFASAAIGENQVKKPLVNNSRFRSLCVGSFISMLGDQLTLVTLPWLALFLFDEPWVLGAVLGALAIPMTVFLLVSGAVVDRFSPKSVLLISKAINAAMMFLLVGLLMVDQLSFWSLISIVLVLGTSSAFAIPAGSALLPELVNSSQLPAANGFGMMLRSLTNIIGPLLAAVLLGIELNSSEGEVSHQGLIWIFSIDGLTFVVSAIILAVIKVEPRRSSSRVNKLLSNVIAGFGYFKQNKELLKITFYLAVVTSFLGGFMQVGMPLMVQQHWQEGSQSYGYLLAFFAFGNVLGSILVSKLRQIIKLSVGASVLLTDLFVGIALIGLSQSTSVLQGQCILFIMGVFAGYVQVIFMSWVQMSTQRELLGRVMGIVTFALIGLLPLSAMLSGFILQSIAIDLFFLIAGAALSIVALSALLFSSIVKIGAVNKLSVASELAS